MIRTLEEAIEHAKEIAEMQKQDAEETREYGEHLSPPSQPYNLIVKACLERSEEYEQLAEWLKELKSFKEGKESRKDFIETVLSVAVTFELDELEVALYLVKRGIKLDDFKYNNDRYNYFKEFFEVHGLLNGAEI